MICLLKISFSQLIELIGWFSFSLSLFMSNIDQFVSAARRGDYNLVSSLLSQGINIDGKDRYSHTALINASCNGHERVVSLLIERGANIDIQNNVRIL